MKREHCNCENIKCHPDGPCPNPHEYAYVEQLGFVCADCAANYPERYITWFCPICEGPIEPDQGDIKVDGMHDHCYREDARYREAEAKWDREHDWER